jgi:hypothetical protein
MSLHGATGHVAVAELFGKSPKTSFRRKKVALSESLFCEQRLTLNTFLKMQVDVLHQEYKLKIPIHKTHNPTLISTTQSQIM